MSFLLLQTGGTDNLLLQIGDNLLLQDSGAGGGGSIAPRSLVISQALNFSTNW